jgi:uncharacterized protein YbjT (DUF2867 family)
MAGTTLVTGATGTLGRQLVPRLVAAGRDVRALSRRAHAAEEARVEWVVGNLRGGTGQERAVTGVDAIVHCATSQRGDLDAARQLLRAAARAGSPHLVYVSIVGIDRVPVGYYRTKLAVERLVADSGLPFTILRATQFHDLILTMFSTQRRLPALLVPARTSVQPVDAGEVADRLTELVAGGPARRVADFGGPEIRDSGDLARRYLRAFGRRRAVLSVPVPGKIGRALRDGGQLAPAHAAGQLTFDQFVATRT